MEDQKTKEAASLLAEPEIFIKKIAHIFVYCFLKTYLKYIFLDAHIHDRADAEMLIFYSFITKMILRIFFYPTSLLRFKCHTLVQYQQYYIILQLELDFASLNGVAHMKFIIIDEQGRMRRRVKFCKTISYMSNQTSKICRFYFLRG